LVDDPENDEPLLFPLPEPVEQEPKVKPIRRPIWTENKAKLIERYLYYFVLITKHGTYIDGFAGPQEPENPEMWAAKLVLESEPRWLKHFFLFDENRNQIKYLKELKSQQPERDSKNRKLYRDIHVFHGDFNKKILEVLDSGVIKSTDATFCLLDQRTFECHWATMAALAHHKPESKHKIELFYFLPIGWLKRALAAQQDDQVLQDWWGRGDWARLRDMTSKQILDGVVERLKNELGYKSVKPWPIFERQNSGNIMYYMVHATDHPEAPGLMSRAYDRAIQPKEEPEQIRLEFGLTPEDNESDK
jgi:three-Cys-motif partner protein